MQQARAGQRARTLGHTLLPVAFSLVTPKFEFIDSDGTLEYALTARNFNPLMAMAATLAIAEAEDIVPVGSIPPDAAVTPGMGVPLLVSRRRDA